MLISGKRRPILFQYEMGTTDNVNQTIDSLLNDWSKIVYLYHLVHEFAEQFKSGMCEFLKVLRFFCLGIRMKQLYFYLFRKQQQQQSD